LTYNVFSYLDFRGQNKLLEGYILLPGGGVLEPGGTCSGVGGHSRGGLELLGDSVGSIRKTQFKALIVKNIYL